MQTVKAPKGKVLLMCGIHRGAKGTRQSLTTLAYDSLENAKQAFEETEKVYKEAGWDMWYAHVFDDEGKKTDILPPVM